MSFKLRTYTGKQPAGQFYIQSKGLHAGRPLKYPIANCFICYTDEEFLFEKVYSLYVGRFFEIHIGGSVVPFIRIDDVKKVIEQSLKIQRDVIKELDTVRKIDELLLNLHGQVKHYKMLKIALCRKINS